MSTAPTGSAKGKGKFHKPRLCWNCRKARHFKLKCLKPPKAPHGGGAAKAAMSDSEDEAFMAKEPSNGYNSDRSSQSDKSMLDLCLASDRREDGGNSEKVWFLEVASDSNGSDDEDCSWESDGSAKGKISDLQSFLAAHCSDSKMVLGGGDTATLVNDLNINVSFLKEPINPPRTEVYDS
ncbi:hypothetical protein C0991_003002, partial [Blastosporella zonata]